MIRSGSLRTGLLAALAIMVLAGCGAAGGGLADATGSTGASAASAASGSSTEGSSGPAPLVVTVPALGDATSALTGEPPAAANSGEPAPSSEGPSSEPLVESAAPQAQSPAESDSETPAVSSSAESSADPAAPAASEPAQPAPPAPAGDGSTVPVTLANCPGCSVLATHAAVTGDLSAALVASGTGRALLLSVGPDGAVRGLINIPYGAEFPAPEGGVLPCDAQARCVVTARQSDGRAILSAFELTGTGAWRDVSGNDGFPSATEAGRTVDLDGALGIAVQDGAPGSAVWMVFGWSGDRYAVVGCAADTSADPSATALDPAACLS